MPANNYVSVLRKYLKKNGSPLAPYARLIARMESRYKIPRGMIVGIAMAETSLGKAGTGPSQFNAWGWMTGQGPPNQRGFQNWGQAIRQYASYLSGNYPVNQGLGSVGGKYVTGNPSNPAPSGWLANASAAMRAVGGDPRGGSPPLSVPSGVGLPSASSTNAAATALTNLRFPNLPANAPINKLDDDKLMRAMLPMLMMGSRTRTNPFTGQPDTDNRMQMLMLPILMAAMGRTQDGVTPANPTGDRTISGNLQFGRRLLGGKFTMGGGPSAHGSRPLGNWQSDHAWDLMARPGTPVYALADGTISGSAGFGFRSNGKSVWGHRLTLDMADGNSAFYTHMGGFAKGIKPGSKIKAGQLIGWVGKWPNDPGRSHLHIGLKKGDLYDYTKKGNLGLLAPVVVTPGSRTTDPGVPSMGNLKGAQFMVSAIKQAQRMGLKVHENPFLDVVDGNHVNGSFHNQVFGKKIAGKTVGRAIDVYGTPAQMLAFTKWMYKTRGRVSEAFYDPWGQWDSGRFSPNGIGNHSDHVHVSI